MGWGDEIMVTAIARQMQLKDPRKVLVVDRHERPRWHEIWDHNPRLLRPHDAARRPGSYQRLKNGSGFRPYLDYSLCKGREMFAYNDYRVEPGEIYLSPSEKRLAELARGMIVIEPTIKAGASPNKDWGFERWKQLAKLISNDAPLVQLGPTNHMLIRQARHLCTRNYREAAAVLSGARLIVTAEGGLHHCAAALGIRGVIIFGGFISPATTGYELHTNLAAPGPACGMRVPCKHCAQAMASITPLAVAEAVRAQLAKAKSFGQNSDAPLSEKFANAPAMEQSLDTNRVGGDR